VCSIGVTQQRPESYPPREREEVGRSQSVKSSAANHRVFRASDLTEGEVLGRGFYGQAIKVSDTCHERTWSATLIELKINTKTHQH